MIIQERRSGTDTRPEAEKRLVGERRSGMDRRTVDAGLSMPPTEQLALFARRLRRTMRDQSSRLHLGFANGESDFAIYPDVTRVVEWIERLAQEKHEHQAGEPAKPSLRKQVAREPTPAAVDAACAVGSPDA
jgi:hypothetical protein